MSPEAEFAKPKSICYCLGSIKIQNSRFYPIRALVLFLINRTGDPYIYISLTLLKKGFKNLSDDSKGESW